MTNKYHKQIVMVDEQSETTTECYILKEKELLTFQVEMISKAPVFVGTETLFPEQKTTFFGLFPSEMPFKGKIIDTEELLFDIGLIGEHNFYIVVYRIDFYNIEVKVKDDQVEKYTLNIKTNQWEKI